MFGFYSAKTSVHYFAKTPERQLFNIDSHINRLNCGGWESEIHLHDGRIHSKSLLIYDTENENLFHRIIEW